MSSHKTIAKNTLFLYVRMLITMAISLYTSRVIIDALGFSDYGLYAVVGGITGVIAFMHSSLAGATTRFLNIEIGRNNHQNLLSVFNSAVIIHVSLALIILILAETVGLWFLYHKINIPDGRFDAAFWVYQFSILSVMMTVIQTPYDAAIIAHQKMAIYAYVSILDALLKLLIAYLVYLSPYDKLIAYGGLVLAVSIIIRLIYQIYCRRNFAECQFKWVINKDYIKSISSFFGWDLFGNFSVVVKYQGGQILVNMFFGSIINASVGIANMVSGIISGFAGNFLLATKPQIFQLYAEGKVDEMLKLLILSSRMTLLMMFLFSIPFLIETEFFLKLWLVEIPPYVTIFTKLTFIQVLTSAVFNVLNQPMHATGKIRMLSLVGGTIIFLNLPITYCIYKAGGSVEYIYYTAVLLTLVGGFVNLRILKLLIPEFSVMQYVSTVIKNLSVLLLGAMPGILLHYFLEKSIVNSVGIVLLLLIGCLTSIYLLGLRQEERYLIVEKIRGAILK